MKNKNKLIALVLSTATLLMASTFGTLAYLTDQEAVVNTFTVGKVGLRLDEALVTTDGTGTPVEPAERWQPTEQDPTQEYHLLPGHSYTKDPTVTVDAGSEAAYVRMMVTITYDEDADAVFAKHGIENWININSADWIVNGNPETTKDATAKTISRTYEFRYKDVVAKSTGETPLSPLFDTLTVPGAVTNTELAELANMKIEVTAHAIQADGLGTADEAWAAFDGQMNPTP